MPPLQITIVGGGIGGLAAAVGLSRNGHKVTVYERSETSGGVGFAFRITPNSDKCLHYLDIDREKGGACAVDGGFMIDEKGNIYNQTRENVEVQKTKGSMSVFAYRPQVHQQLWDATIKSGAQLRVGVKVESVNADRSTVTLEDGETVPADLIIGADGVKSVVRPEVIDTSKYFPRSSTGHNAFRFMIPTQKAREDKILAPFYEEGGNMIYSWTAGQGRRVLAYPVDFGRQINIVCTHPEHMSDKETGDGDEASQIDYNQKVTAKTAIGIYKDLEPRAARVLGLADPDGFRIWKLMDMEEIPRWSNNSTVLLGDACHPVLPFGFSGASMAIEDGLTLSTLLPSDIKKEELQDRLKLYEEIRKPRIGRVRETSRAIGKSTLHDTAVYQDYFSFLAGHDAVEHAKEVLSSSRPRATQPLRPTE